MSECQWFFLNEILCIIITLHITELMSPKNDTTIFNADLHSLYSPSFWNAARINLAFLSFPPSHSSIAVSLHSWLSGSVTSGSSSISRWSALPARQPERGLHLPGKDHSAWAETLSFTAFSTCTTIRAMITRSVCACAHVWVLHVTVTVQFCV